MDWEVLISAAAAARQQAYEPYSRFAVGAAALVKDGTIFSGCNVENRTFGLTTCAERVAVHSAVAAGHRELKAIAIITDSKPPAPPCGMCREVLTEFADPELPILLVNTDGERLQFRLGELLPHPFVFPAPTDPNA